MVNVFSINVFLKNNTCMPLLQKKCRLARCFVHKIYEFEDFLLVMDINLETPSHARTSFVSILDTMILDHFLVFKK